MNRLLRIVCVAAACVGLAVFAVSSESVVQASDGPPVFVLSWSEYPSWSAFGVASEVGLINGKRGQQGEIEKKYNIDIVLELSDYDTCLQKYGAGQCDAVCITNMDVLNPALSRASVGILPTSTSHGADALLVNKSIGSVADLKGQDIRLLTKTVSEYMCARNLEMQGHNLSDFNFVNMDPGAAALAMQQGDAKIQAIAVWNPYVLQTLNKRKDVRVLFDSTTIPGEIVDMVVVDAKSLARPGGENFAKAVCETFYRLNQRLNDPATKDDTLIALGEKFANLTVGQMRQCVRQTKFYGTPSAGLAVFTGPKLKATMGMVSAFCTKADILPQGKSPTIGYGSASEAPNVDLRFDPTYMSAVATK